MGVKVITPPAQVITTADLRLHLRADEDDTSENPLIVAYLSAALAYAQHYTGRSIGEQTLELALDEFPGGYIELPQGKVKSVTSIKYIGTDGIEATLDPALYSLDDYGIADYAVPKFGTVWPATDGSKNSVKVRYVAGDLPAAAITALKLIVGDLYENRQDSSSLRLDSIPNGAKVFLDTFRIWSF
jgi:uncharacterized phiE125 gp8 family phage protein